jgi:hypothetical protein
LGKFTHATALDLSMGYYHFVLTPRSQQMCTIVLPWGKYYYKRLPMGLSISPDVFQQELSSLFHDLAYVKVFIDDILVITKGTYEDHLENWEKFWIGWSRRTSK